MFVENHKKFQVSKGKGLPISQLLFTSIRNANKSRLKNLQATKYPYINEKYQQNLA